MDETTRGIVTKALESWRGAAVDRRMLLELRNEITSRTGRDRFAPLSDVVRWIRMVKKEMAKKSKTKAGGRAAPESRAITAPVGDRVFLQNISFEIAGMRRALERLMQQLDEVEASLGIKRAARAEETL